MRKIYGRFHIGLRTVKTVAAVILSMVIVDSYGTTDSKLVFAMLGAMAAMQPTFKDSVESCLTQIIGVLFGGVMGALLRMLPVPQLVATGLGLMLVIVLYNALRIRFSPSLPCFIVVMVCITPTVAPMQYAFGRVWDSAIGLAVGMLINTLVFPYDNSRMIRKTVENLDRELLRFMEKMAGYNAVLPDVSAMEKYMSDLTSQLNIFSRQKFFTRARWQSGKLAELRRCESYARELIAHLEVLSVMEKAGVLNEENREKLKAFGTLVCESGESVSAEADLITNYHVSQILRLRQELLAQVRM